ncbi:unnamed protein product [Adineta ricciae]|uniref:Uncharacterized protein n=1 Tax=Adineta ricciae TaxID=249248 RepID=A0A814B7J6_ADIRI|nr:unnamed protein product [Adineta ricciae]
MFRVRRDPTWDPRPSESNAIPSPGFHWIRRIPVGSDKILYWIRWDPSMGLFDLGTNVQSPLEVAPASNTPPLHDLYPLENTTATQFFSSSISPTAPHHRQTICAPSAKATQTNLIDELTRKARDDNNPMLILSIRFTSTI